LCHQLKVILQDNYYFAILTKRSFKRLIMYKMLASVALSSLIFILSALPVLAQSNSEKKDNQSIFKTEFKVESGNSSTIYAAHGDERTLTSFQTLFGASLLKPYSQIIGSAGLSHGDRKGYRITVDAAYDERRFNIKQVRIGFGLNVFLSKDTELVFHSPEPPSLRYDGEHVKRFLLTDVRTGVGNYSDNHFRVQFMIGVGEVEERQRLYVEGKRTTDQYNQSLLHKNMLPMGGIGLSGNINIWKDLAIKGSYRHLQTLNIADQRNTQHMLPPKNNIFKAELALWQTRLYGISAFGAWTNDKYAYTPVGSQKSAGLVLNIFPTVF
jgi:hypothetical protein